MSTTTIGMKLYNPQLEAWFDGKKVIIQKVNLLRDREPFTHITMEGIITEELKDECDSTKEEVQRTIWNEQYPSPY